MTAANDYARANERNLDGEPTDELSLMSFGFTHYFGRLKEPGGIVVDSGGMMG